PGSGPVPRPGASWSGCPFEPLQEGQGVRPGFPAHFLGRTKAGADFGAFRLPEEPAAVILGPLDAAGPRRLALGRAGEGGRDGRGDTTGPAADPAAEHRGPV